MNRCIDNMMSIVLEWIDCLVCGNKISVQIRQDMELKNIYSDPTVGKNVNQCKTNEYILKYPVAQTQN